jgi:RNA polymerase sigma-70 factor (ECF subfamily)
MQDKGSKNSAQPYTSRFATTHWSVVRAAGKSSSPRYKEAMGTLCRTYWFPLYAFLRRQGHNVNQAEEYTQAFFTRLLEKRGLRLADSKRGKFRSFLLAALKNFLADERDRASAKKRGGGRKVLSLDFENAENQYTLQPAQQLPPEKLFERSWALTVLERTMVRLQDESRSAKKRKVFDHLKVYLTAEKDSIPYREVADKLKMAEGAVKVAVHRLRHRYRELLRDEIAQTVATEEQIDEEIRDLFAALAG